MNKLIDQSSVEAEQQLKCAQMMIAAQDYANALTQSGYDAFLASATDAGNKANVVSATWKAVADKLRALTKLMRDDPVDARVIPAVERHAREALQMEIYMTKIDPSNLDLEDIFRMGVGKEMNIKLFLGMRPLLQRYESIRNPEGAELLTEDVRNGLFTAIAASLTLSLVALTTFAIDCVRRLRKISRNSQSLASGGWIEWPGTGGDEISQLDRIIFDTAQQLRELERARSALFALIGGYLAQHVRNLAEQIDILKANAELLNERGQELLAKSSSSVDRLSRLIDELAQSAEGRQALNFKTIQLSEILQRSVESVSQIAEDKSITIEHPAATVTLRADGDKLIQVLINLLSNAIKFSPNGSTIRVISEAQGNSVIVKVIDQGRGIPEEFRRRMFSRFEQAHAQDAARSRGTGLGLAICKTIIEDHSGTIAVESEPGRGSTFTISLPVEGPSADGKSHNDEPAKAIMQGANSRILNPFAWLSRCAPLWVKGLVLISVPLILEIGFLCAGFPIVARSDREIKDLSATRASACAAVELNRDLLLVVRFAILFNKTHKLVDGDRCYDYRKSCIKDLERLEWLAPDPQIFAEIKDATDKILRASEKGMHRTQILSGMDVASDPELGQGLRNAVGQLIDAVSKFIARAESDETRNPFVAADMRKTLAKVSALAAFADCILLATLMWLIFGSINKRLKHIIENAKRLADNRRLALPIAGADEIAEVDRTCYASATKVQELQRLKDELLSVLSHELRTPLTGIQGMFFLLSTSAFGELDPRCTKAALAASDECATIINLVNDLLDTEKIKAGKMHFVRESLELSELVDEALDYNQPAARRKDVSLVRKTYHEYSIFADRDRLRHAVKMMIALAVTRSPAGGMVEISDSIDSQGWRFLVSDEGPPLDDEAKRVLFEPFARSDQIGIQVRLGLSLSRSVAESHGGSLVETDVRGRTALQLLLPLSSRSTVSGGAPNR